MKKNYLIPLTLAIVMVNTVWAQRVKPLATSPFITMEPISNNPGASNLPTAPASSNDRAYGSVIWSQDFGTAVTGGIPAGWSQSGTKQVWKKTFEGSSGQYSSKTVTLNSTTKSNGVLIFDADSVTTKGGANVATDGAVISDVINLTGKPNVLLEFQQYFRLCCNLTTTTLTVSVSKDGGTTWTDFDARGGVALNNYPLNPTTVQINISAATLSSNNVKLKFNFASETGTYFWQIDDIKILEGPNNDLKLEAPWVNFGYGSKSAPDNNGGYYTQTPISQVAPISFAAGLLNAGGLAQKNVKLHVDVSKGGSSVYSKTSTNLATTVIGHRDTLEINGVNSFTVSPTAPATIGTYTTTFTFTADSVDQNPSNNQFTRTFDISDTVYARDFGLTSGATVGTLGPNNYVNGKMDGSVIASLFEFPAATDITSVSAYIANNSSVGASFEFVLYDTSLTTDFALSNTYSVTTTADRGKWVTLPFQSGKYHVLAGESYYVGLRCYGLSATPTLSIYTLNDLSKIDVQRANGSTVFYLAKASPPGWFNVGASSPYIRLAVKHSSLTGIEEFEAQNGVTLEQNVPNPATSSTVIKYSVEKNAEVKFSVYDVTGRKMFDKNEGNVVAGGHAISLDLTTFSKGVYFYTLTANGHSLTKKMVITE